MSWNGLKEPSFSHLIFPLCQILSVSIHTCLPGLTKEQTRCHPIGVGGPSDGSSLGIWAFFFEPCRGSFNKRVEARGRRIIVYNKKTSWHFQKPQKQLPVAPQSPSADLWVLKLLLFRLTPVNIMWNLIQELVEGCIVMIITTRNVYSYLLLTSTHWEVFSL